MEIKAPFEIYIVRVHWASKTESVDVETAQAPVCLVNDGQGRFLAEISAYPEVSPQRQGQIAVFMPDSDSPPALMRADGARSELSPVKGADGRTWWIERGQWKKDGGYYDAPLCRHAGEAQLRVGSMFVRLRIAAPGFTPAEFETLLDEFRNGLWQLVLDPTSTATVTDRQSDGGVSEAFLDAVRDHVRHANRALDQPHRELRERQEQQPLARVRPTTRTFQELAARGMPQRITGRGHAPTFDTPENRQLLTMTSRILRSLRALHRAAQGASEDFQRRAKDAERRAADLERSEGWTKVDPERLRQEIAEQQARQRAFREGMARLVADKLPEPNSSTFEIKVTSPVKDEYGDIGFWADLIMVQGGKNRASPERIILVFNHDFDALSEVFIRGEIYTISGAVQRLDDVVRRYDERCWKKFRVVRLFQLSSPLENKLEIDINRLQTAQSRLEQNDYWRRLTSSEVNEQRRDHAAEVRQARHFHSAETIWSTKTKALEPLIMQAAQVVDRARSLGISQSLRQTFSGSMTYVQNPDYRGAQAAYRRAMDAANLDTTKLDQLFRIDEVGILDLPAVYERWCLLKIIRVLREHFKMIPETRYRDNLLQRLATEWRANATLAIRFERPQLQRDVLLEYQPKFRQPDSRQPRTPDFALTLIPRDDVSQHSDTYPKLVLDAKCKRFDPVLSPEGGANLADELQTLIVTRGYDQDARNRVFVLHPGPDTESTKDWRRFCHYGGWHFTPDPESRPAWDQGPPDHRHGAVLLRPGATDHLTRLIMMHFYLGLDNSQGAYTNRSPRFRRICPACGGIELSDSPPPEIRRPKTVGRAVWCKDCQQMIVWNFSGGCGTHLWKLGGYWTFHETHPLNPYDIKCPHCGDYMKMFDEPEEQECWES